MSNQHRRLPVFLACLILSVSGTVYAVTLSDGRVHTENFPYASAYVLRNGTTLNLNAPGRVYFAAASEAGVRVESGSKLNVAGARIQGGTSSSGIQLVDGTVEIHSGTILGASGLTMDRGTVTIRGGELAGLGTSLSTGALIARGGTLNILAGVFRTPSGLGIKLEGNTHATFRNGSLTGGASVWLTDNSTLDINGGNFSGSFLLEGNAALHVYGYRLKWNGTRLTGWLQNGHAIDFEVRRFYNGQVHLHYLPFPEPSSVVLALSGLAGLLAVAWRRHHRA